MREYTQNFRKEREEKHSLFFSPLPLHCLAAAAFPLFRITLPMFRICYNLWSPPWPPFPKPVYLPYLKSGMVEKKTDWTLNERFVISSLLSQLPLHCCSAFKGPFLISTTMEHVIVQLFGMVNSRYDYHSNYFTSLFVFSVPSEAKIKD